MKMNSTNGKLAVLALTLSLAAHFGGPTAAAAESSAIADLTSYLQRSNATGDALPIRHQAMSEQPFARVPLSREQSAAARDLLWKDLKRRIEIERAEEMKNRELVVGDHKMRFDYRVLGEPPADGRSLYISMHGGGGAPSRVNDQPWENQKVHNVNCERTIANLYRTLSKREDPSLCFSAEIVIDH